MAVQEGCKAPLLAAFPRHADPRTCGDRRAHGRLWRCGARFEGPRGRQRGRNGNEPGGRSRHACSGGLPLRAEASPPPPPPSPGAMPAAPPPSAPAATSAVGAAANTSPITIAPEPSRPLPRSGQLTAGVWDDNRNFEFWKPYQAHFAESGGSDFAMFTASELAEARAAADQQHGARTELDVQLVLDTTGSMGDELGISRASSTRSPRRSVRSFPASPPAGASSSTAITATSTSRAPSTSPPTPIAFARTSRRSPRAAAAIRPRPSSRASAPA